MAVNPKLKLTLIIGGSLIAVALIGLSVLRAPGTSIEGIGGGLGFSSDAPAQEFTRELENFPITVNGEQFTAGELGVMARELPTVPRASNFSAWGKTYTVELRINGDKTAEALSTLDGYVPPKDSVLVLNGDTWSVTPAVNGLNLPSDLASDVLTALREHTPKLEISLQETPPALTNEKSQLVADRMNSASLEVLAGSTPVESFKGAKLAELVTIAPKYGEYTLSVNTDKVTALTETYATTLAREKVDGEQVVDEEGNVLKSIQAPQDGFIPGAKEDIQKNLVGALADIIATPVAVVNLPGQVDAAKPKNMMRTAMVDASDHTAYFYENGAEVARFPIAVGKPGTETDRGTFKVYTQLTSQNMGSCDSNGNLREGSFDYCTPDVPWVTYFNGDEGFHGTYWHNNFGNPSSNMSHGCVNMRVEDAKWAYEFLQTGSTVTIQD
jgi:hypothetical protein